MKKIVFLTALLCMIMAGCASYTPQPNLPQEIKSVAIPVFANKTDKFNMEQYVTQKTIDQFIADGKVTVQDEYKADAAVKCTITKYVLTPILFDVSQVPQQYRLRIYITISLFDNKLQRELWQVKDMWEETTYYVVNNIGMPAEDEETAKRRVLDLIASRIMRRVLYGTIN